MGGGCHPAFSGIQTKGRYSPISQTVRRFTPPVTNSSIFIDAPNPSKLPPHPLAVVVRRALILLIVLVLLLVALVVLSNLWICGSTKHNTFSEVADIPKRKVALVLGTSKYASQGKLNQHFINRVDAAAALYEAGKAEHLLVSGDNRTKHYNEPRDLRESLIERGVPGDRITCDFAGLRTLDSVIRAKEVFGQEQLTVVSDDFHVPRAIYIAKANGIDAVGLQAVPVPKGSSGKSRSREWFARVKALMDIHLFGTEPRHYGDPVEIGSQSKSPNTGAGDSKTSP